MCNRWCLTFGERLRERMTAGARVLDVGSRDVNGSLRTVLADRAGDYVGVDIEAGPGVDLVGDAVDLPALVGVNAFDTVVTTEMIEHCLPWRDAMHAMLRTLKPGGLFLLTTRSPGFALHGYPTDHWRFTRADMRRILEPVCEVIEVVSDPTLGWACGVGVLARRTAGDAALDAWRAQLDQVHVYEVQPGVDVEGVHRTEIAEPLISEPPVDETNQTPPAGAPPARGVASPEPETAAPGGERASDGTPEGDMSQTHASKSSERVSDRGDDRGHSGGDGGQVEPGEASFIAKSAERLKGMLYSPGARRAFNAHGLHVIPANFYSVVPSFEDIERSFEYAEPGAAPYDDRRVFDLARMDAVLSELTELSREFEPPTEGDGARPDGFFWNNPAFSYSDAMSYYAFVRLWQPELVLEVGSGFSTLVASAAVERNGKGRIVCVEPYPKPWLSGVKHVAEVVDQPVQALGSDWFNERLRDGDLFFIDSTHAVKTGSDCAHLYLRVIPELRRHLLLHAHDIFLPHGYPREWLEKHAIFWNEQYILYALLLGNPHLRVLFGSSALHHHRPEALQAFMHGRCAPGGGSLWYEHVPAQGL